MPFLGPRTSLLGLFWAFARLLDLFPAFSGPVTVTFLELFLGLWTSSQPLLGLGISSWPYLGPRAFCGLFVGFRASFLGLFPTFSGPRGFFWALSRARLFWSFCGSFSGLRASSEFLRASNLFCSGAFVGFFRPVPFWPFASGPLPNLFRAAGLLNLFCQLFLGLGPFLPNLFWASGPLLGLF